MRVFQGIFAAIGVIIAGILALIILLPMLVTEESEQDRDKISDINDDLLVGAVGLPVRRSDESMLPYATVSYSPDLLTLGNKPTGGKTFGWTIPDGYVQSGARTIVLGYADHAGYAVDLSVFGQPNDLVPVYSPIIGTVVETHNTSGGGKPGYGEFTRIRNAKWACVNNEELWKWNQQPGKLTYDDGSNSEANIRSRCKPCGAGSQSCFVSYSCTVGLETVDSGDVCETEDPPCGPGERGSKGGVIVRAADYSSRRACVQDLTASDFYDNKLPDLGYGKISNYEVVASHLGEGSLAQYTCTDGSVVNNQMQCGTMGTTGKNNSGQSSSLEPLVHYEVWRSNCEVLSPPDTFFKAQNPEEFLGKTDGDQPEGIPAPCCPSIAVPGFSMIGGLSSTSLNTGQRGTLMLNTSIVDDWTEVIGNDLKVTYKVTVTALDSAGTSDGWLTIVANGASNAQFWQTPPDSNEGPGTFKFSTAFFGGRNIGGESSSFDVTVVYGNAAGAIDDPSSLSFGVKSIQNYEFGEDGTATLENAAMNEEKKEEYKRQIARAAALCTPLSGLDQTDGSPREAVAGGDGSVGGAGASASIGASGGGGAAWCAPGHVATPTWSNNLERIPLVGPTLKLTMAWLTPAVALAADETYLANKNKLGAHMVYTHSQPGAEWDTLRKTMIDKLKELDAKRARELVYRNVGGWAAFNKEDGSGTYFSELAASGLAIDVYVVEDLTHNVPDPDTMKTQLGEYVAFIKTSLLTPFGSSIATVTVGNEPNLAKEGLGGNTEASAKKYVEVVKAVRAGVGTSTKLVAAPLTPSVGKEAMQNYLRWMIAAGIEDQVDYFGVNEYPIPGSGQHDDPPNKWVTEVLVEKGLSHKILVTESGWCAESTGTACAFANENYVNNDRVIGFHFFLLMDDKPSNAGSHCADCQLVKYDFATKQVAGNSKLFDWIKGSP